MNDLQKCQFEMLKTFIEVCEKNHLQYFLIGGSALGAVRHKGFIPWDDDIDVGMPRKDYEKFIKLQKDLPEYYFIQTYETDKNYIYNFAKIRDSRTTFIENFYRRTNINHGVWVDIFPLDGMCDKEIESKKLKHKSLRIWANVYCNYVKCFKRRIHFKTCVTDILFDLAYILTFWLSIGKIRNRHVDRIMQKYPYESSVLVGNIHGTNPSKEAMHRDVFGEGVEGEFEGIKVMLPAQTDKYLTNLYHDYMKLPPEEKRIGHHYNDGFSLTQGYKEYIKEHKVL